MDRLEESASQCPYCGSKNVEYSYLNDLADVPHSGQWRVCRECDGAYRDLAAAEEVPDGQA